MSAGECAGVDECADEAACGYPGGVGEGEVYLPVVEL